jgi:hypothetical protein
LTKTSVPEYINRTPQLGLGHLYRSNATTKGDSDYA